MPRTSLFGTARASRASEGRFSLAGAGVAPPSSSKRPVMQPPRFTEKDNRPLNDKAYQQQIVERISDYLHHVEVDAPLNLSEIDLRTPSKNTVRILFEFLYQKLDPDWQMPDNKDTGRFDTQFMAIFSTLGYPFPLKNSQMQTMTAPHTWPQMLAALDWLLAFVQLDEEINQSHLNVDDNRVRAEYSYYTSCYRKQKRTFQGDVVDFTQELNAFRNLVMPEDDVERDAEELRAQTTAYNEEADRLQDQLSEEHQEIRAREAEEKTYEGDVAKLEEFIANTNDQISVCSDDSHNLNAELLKLKDELAQVVADNTAKEHTIRGQKITGDEARQMYQRKRMLNEQLQTRSDQLEEVKIKVDQDQQVLWKRKHALRDRYREFLRRFEDLTRQFPTTLTESDYAFLAQANPATLTFLTEGYVGLQQLVRRTRGLLHDFRQQHRNNMSAARELISQLASRCEEFQRDNAAVEENGKLALERLEREGDSLLPKVQEAKHALQKYQQQMAAAKDRYKAVSAENTNKREELAELEQKHGLKKKELELLYEEQMASVVEAFERIFSYMEELNEEAELMREVGQMLRDSDADKLALIKAIKSIKK